MLELKVKYYELVCTILFFVLFIYIIIYNTIISQNLICKVQKYKEVNLWIHLTKFGN